MFRASIILKNTREDKGLEISEVSKKLKIPKKYLEVIENETKACFPNEPYCSLMIKDYAQFLGLNGDEVISIFRRDFAIPRSSVTANPKKFFFTPQFTFKIGVFFSVVLFSGYLVLEYLKFNRPPDLKINWPEASSVDKIAVEITGTTDSESTIRINDDLVIVDSQGNFSKKINLSPPETKIVIESKSPSGASTFAEKTYRLEDAAD